MATVRPDISGEEPRPNTDITVDEENSENREATELCMDCGLTAWMQVLGSWILFANTWGLTNSFGVFQTYYINVLLPTSTPSAIAWIGSTQLFLTMLVGVFAGWLLDAGYLRFLLVSGTVLEFFGTLMTSFCTQYWQILLAQGICVGLGSGFLGLASVAIIPLYFSRKRMIATGIAATGSSLAGILYPILLRRLFVSIGFPWAVRTLSFLMLISLIICCAIMRLRPHQRLRGPLFEIRQFRDGAYFSFVIAFTAMIASVYVPFFYIQDYALKLGVNDDMAFYLLSIMNAASLFGRLIPNWLADRLGGVHVMLPCCFFSAIVLFLFRLVYDLPGLVVVAIAYGFISGGMVSLPPATIANLTKNPSEYGTRMGMGYTIASLGALIGGPVSGAAQRPISDIQLGFQGTWIFAGAVMLLSVFAMLVARYERIGMRLGGKV